jgi:murein DD-endopeptidase MepM/ murein hydrolase activator NlpD
MTVVMVSRISTLARYLTSVLLVMLTACSQAPSYAPVKTVNQALKPKSGNDVENTPINPNIKAESPQKLAKPGLSGQQILPSPSKKKFTSEGNNQGSGYQNRINQDGVQKKSAPKITSFENKTQAVRKPIQLSQKTEVPKKNQNVKQNTEKNAPVIKQQKSASSALDSTKRLKNNATISNATIIASQNSAVDRAKSSGNVLSKEKKIKEEKSIISIDNKKMLKLNFEWPLQGKMTRNFAQTDHKGIDIAGKNGQLVRAAESGKAVYCGQGLKGFGNLAIIKHNETYLSAYANNSRLYITEGQQVKKGQKIGQVSASGLKKTSLHFEIRKHGKPINPLSLLPNL